jgi:RNA recognition motif-containing protein
MSDSHAAEMAINALNGQELDGRALNVNLAKPKTERSGGGSRDGRSNRW